MKILELLKELESINQSIEGLNLALAGTLGAGKTHLSQQLAEQFFSIPATEVSSPTFNLINHYEIKKGFKSKNLIHIDLYRIEKSEELFEIGIYEILDDDKAVVFVEWADLFDEILEMCHYIIEIAILDDGERDYKLRKLD